MAHSQFLKHTDHSAVQLIRNQKAACAILYDWMYFITLMNSLVRTPINYGVY